MKKIVAILLPAALTLSLASCGVRITVGAPAAPEPDYGVGLANLTVVREAQTPPDEPEPQTPADTTPETPPAGDDVPDAPDIPDAPDPGGTEDQGAEDPQGPDVTVDIPGPDTPDDPDAPDAGQDGNGDDPNPAGPGENETPPEDEPPVETPPVETPPVETPPAVEPPPANEPPVVEPEPPKLTAQEMRAIAESMLDRPASELIAAIGEPVSSEYVPSCLVDGEDGMLYYDGFTVYTERTAESEVITNVE